MDQHDPNCFGCGACITNALLQDQQEKIKEQCGHINRLELELVAAKERAYAFVATVHELGGRPRKVCSPCTGTGRVRVLEARDVYFGDLLRTFADCGDCDGTGVSR